MFEIARAHEGRHTWHHPGRRGETPSVQPRAGIDRDPHDRGQIHANGEANQRFMELKETRIKKYTQSNHDAGQECNRNDRQQEIVVPRDNPTKREQPPPQADGRAAGFQIDHESEKADEGGGI